MSGNSVRLGLQDLIFIYGETSSSKMHVAGLLPFTPPADAPRDYLRQMIGEARRQVRSLQEEKDRLAQRTSDEERKTEREREKRGARERFRSGHVANPHSLRVSAAHRQPPIDGLQRTRAGVLPPVENDHSAISPLLWGLRRANGACFPSELIARRGRRARGGRRRARSSAVQMPRAPGKALRAHLANVGRKGQGCPCCTPNLIIRAETRCRRVGEEGPLSPRRDHGTNEAPSPGPDEGTVAPDADFPARHPEFQAHPPRRRSVDDAACREWTNLDSSRQSFSLARRSQGLLGDAHRYDAPPRFPLARYRRPQGWNVKLSPGRLDASRPEYIQTHPYP